MSLFARNIDEFLTDSDNKLSVAENDREIQPLLAAAGYDLTVIQAGRVLYTTAYDLQQTRIREYGEQYGATDEFKQAKKTTFDKYMQLVGLARIVFKRDRNILNQLDLFGDRERSYDKMVMQMKRFYDNALASADTVTRLGRFNITADVLTTGSGLIDDMQLKHRAQLKETSDAQRATHDRDEAVEDLDDWMSDFIGVAKITLAHEPQYLERLGIVDPS